MSTEDTDASMNGSLAFYEKANLFLRIAVFIAFLWPISALLSSMFLSPMKAQTLVPIISFIPVLAVLFVIVGAPFIVGLLLSDRLVRKGFIYFIGFLGIELTISIYLSVTPISNDAGLSPLLILTVLALFFLWVAQIARPLRIILTITIFAITAVFFSGGRVAVQKNFMAMLSGPEISPPPTDNHPAEIHPALVSHQVLASAKEKPIVSLSEKPAVEAITPTQATQSQLLESSKETPIPAAAPLPPKPREFHPNWSSAISANISIFNVSMAPCIFVSADLRCFFRIVNHDSDQMPIQLTGTGQMAIRAFDDQGTTYSVARIDLAGKSGEQVWAVLPSEVPVLGSVTFENFTGTSLPLIEFQIYADPNTPHSPFTDGRNRILLNLRRVPVEQRTND